MTKPILFRRDLRSWTCSWGHDVRFIDQRHLLQQTLKKNFAVEIIPKEEQGWKSIRKWADIWRSANSVQQIRKWRAYCDPCTTTVFISDDRHPHGPNFSYNSQVLQRKHPVLDIKLSPLSLLFQPARYHRNNTNKRPQQCFRTFRRNHVFSVALGIAGVMTRARILLVRPQATRVFRIFVTSTWLINREFLVFPSVHFFKKLPHFLAVAVPLYCPFLVNICKS